MNKSELREFLKKYFNESELRSLCFDLDVNYDALLGSGLEDKTRELIGFVERRGRLNKLLGRLSELRPNLLQSEFAFLADNELAEIRPKQNLEQPDISYLVNKLQQIIDGEKNDQGVQSDVLGSSLNEIALLLANLRDDRSRTENKRTGLLRNFRMGWNKGTRSRELPDVNQINFNRVSWRTLGWIIAALVGDDIASPAQTDALFSALESIRNSRRE